jgi:hypothetical protein
MTVARTIERRRALTVDARVRRLYLVVVALAGLEVALIAGLGVAFRHAARPVPSSARSAASPCSRRSSRSRSPPT